MKNIAILGSTGSVGRSSLEVIRSNRESYKVELLVANSNFKLLIEQYEDCLLYTSPSPRDVEESRMPSSA